MGHFLLFLQLLRSLLNPSNLFDRLDDLGHYDLLQNYSGLQIQWFISVGSNVIGGSNGDVWHHYADNTFAFGHVTSTHITTDESTFQLTGCQFEIGDIATPFEHRTFEKNLEKTVEWYLDNRDWWQPLLNLAGAGQRHGNRS